MDSLLVEPQGSPVFYMSLIIDNAVHILFITVVLDLLSHVHLLAIQWTVQSMEFSRPEYWSE